MQTIKRINILFLSNNFDRCLNLQGVTNKKS